MEEEDNEFLSLAPLVAALATPMALAATTHAWVEEGRGLHVKERGISEVTQVASSITNKPSYTAKKPLPRVLLLLRNSTQSRLSVEMSGSGALSPQNLPGKWERTVRLSARSREGLAAGRQKAVVFKCGSR